MKIYLRLLAIFTTLHMVSTCDVWASTFCDEFADRERSGLSDAQAITEVCTAEIDSFNGTFVFVEKGFLPISKDFYLKLPHENFISMDSALMANKRSEWSYGVLFISGLERSRLQYASEKNEINHRVIQEFRRACQISLDVWGLRFEMPGSTYAPYFTEARVGQTRILLAGEPYDLMLAMLDSFLRLNCEVENTGQTSN